MALPATAASSAPAGRIVRTPTGVSLWTQCFGQPGGRPLLLIMGAMNPGLFWPQAFCDGLAHAGCFVIRYDHRDTGQSSGTAPQAPPYSLADLVDDAWAVLDAYQLPRASIMGLSMGGYIAQCMAAAHPDRVDHLILLSTTADHRPYMAATTEDAPWSGPLPAPASRFLDALAATRRQPPHTRDEVQQAQLAGWRACHGGSTPFPEADMQALLASAQAHNAHPPFAAAWRHGQAVGNAPDRIELVGHIKAPTLVIHGSDDPCLPLPHGEQLATLIPHARLVVLDMGHMLAPPMATELARIVLAFMFDDLPA